MLQLLLLLEAAPNCHVNDHGCYHRNYYHGISLQLRLLFLPLCPFCCCICPFAAVSATTTTTAQPTPATTTTTASRTAAPPTMVAFKATPVSLFTLGIFAMSARGGVVKYRALLASRRGVSNCGIFLHGLQSFAGLWGFTIPRLAISRQISRPVLLPREVTGTTSDNGSEKKSRAGGGGGGRGAAKS